MKRDYIRFERIDKGGYLFDGVTGYVYLLNETGSIIAENILYHSKEDAIAQLINEYDVNGDELRRDVEDFITKMEELLCQQE